MMIKGETVTLISKVSSGEDDFGQPVYTEGQIAVNNVLVGSPSSEDVINELNISGKHIEFSLAIPKGDTNTWENTSVLIRGKRYRTIGLPVSYTEHNMPSYFAWNKIIKVERYE